jgi:SUN domain-containing protein 1/2
MAESGLASIPEIEEPLETDLDPDVPLSKSSGSSFSIGGFLGKLVNVILRSIMNIVSSIFSALGYISWASTQALGIALEGPKNLWKNNSGALVSLVVLALAVYALRQGGTTIPWIAPSRPAEYTPPESPAADVSELSTRLQAVERAMYELGADSRHSHRRIENDLTKTASDFLDKLSALDKRLTADVSKINEADGKDRQTTNSGIAALKKSIEELQKKIQDGSLPGQKGDESSKELEKLLEKQREALKAEWKVIEERVGTVEGDVKEALELGKSIPKTGAGNAPAWWNKITGKPLSEVTIKSTDGQDVTALIRQMVDSATSNWSKDVLARPDFALHSTGAQIIPSLTSATYSISPEGAFGKAVGFVTGSGHATGLSPINALHPQNYAGRCWPFKGSEGQLGVKLALRTYISDITIDHVAKEVAFDLRSTPRQMEVWGLVEGQDNLAKVAGWLADRQRRRSDAVEFGNAMDPKDEEWEVPEHLPKDAQYIRVANFLFDVHSTKNIQTFPVDSEVRALGVDFGVVVLVIKNNWGRSEYTCLYRFRVHGDMVGEIPPLYEPPSEEQTEQSQ